MCKGSSIIGIGTTWLLYTRAFSGRSGGARIQGRENGVDLANRHHRNEKVEPKMS